MKKEVVGGLPRAVRLRNITENQFIIVMVREGGPPMTLQRLGDEKEVVGGLPSQTMTQVGVCDLQ